MSQIDTEALASFIKEAWNIPCDVQKTDLKDTRFSLKIICDGLPLQVTASDARICLSIVLGDLPLSGQNSLLSQIALIKGSVENDLSPYKLTLWKDNEKTYAVVPDIEKLKANPQFSIDVCTGPCDISDSNKAQAELKGLLVKALEWLLSMREPFGNTEGERENYLASKVERSKKNRALCIAIHGYDCKICDIKLVEKYGSLAENFIHVHHIESLAKYGPRWIDPAKDLIPVCPNCHAMLHRKTPALLPQELKKIIEEHNNG